MLKNLVLRELALDQARDAELDELPAERTAMIPVGEKAVMHHLHRDGAEAFTDAE